MKKIFVLFAALLLLVTAANFTYIYISAEQDTDKTAIEKTDTEKYKYPEFYRGIYLNVVSYQKNPSKA